ncbi:MAG TPA: GNAT family N-acetyltransferase, partial [Solirubrobacteraceae bacterium]|nr:GNAT family N-acetyltransferase [Solirubrobacteraceae bacterium]
MARLPSLTEALQNAAVRLRDAAERDIPEILIAHEDDPSMHLRLGLERPPSGAELGRQAESGHADRLAGSGTTLALTRPGADLCLGQLAVHHVDWDHGWAELTLWVAPQARRRGLGSGALALAAPWLFAEAGLERLHFLCEPDNVPMQRAGARAGFVQEALLHGYVRRRARRLDML